MTDLAADPGLLTLFLVCAGSGMFLPFPEDIPLLYAGMRISTGDAHWAPTFAAAFLGVLCRDLFAFMVGRVVGSTLLEHRLVVRILGAKRIERARRLVGARGTAAIGIGRVLVGMRSPVFVVAGAAGMPIRDFLLVDMVGLLVCVPVALVVGHQFGGPVIGAFVWALQQTRVVGAAAAIVGGSWLAFRVWKRRSVVLAEADAVVEDDELDEDVP